MSDMQAERSNGNLVIQPTGKIDGGTSGGVQRELDSIIDRQDQTVILDQAGIKYISSASLRVIAVALNRAPAGPSNWPSATPGPTSTRC